MRKIQVVLIFILGLFKYSSGYAQDAAAYIRQESVEIKKNDSLGMDVYNKLKDYNLIMIGEMHGTSEPAAFLTGLVSLFIDHGESLQVGLEIPPDMMTEDDPSKSVFFKDGFRDGRSSEAWAAILTSFRNNPRVRFFYFDGTQDELAATKNRDSLMYTRVKYNILQHPECHRTILLSGNLHNIIEAKNDKKYMGGWLENDQDMKLKILSFNHIYTKGSMRNNTGNGLELHEVNNGESLFSTAVSYENYLVVFPLGSGLGHNGVLFTNTVTAADIFKEN